MRTLAVFLSCFLAALCASAPRLSAQQLTAAIHGTVSDSSGGAISGAVVKAVNTETHVATTVPTQADGTFEFLQLPVGTYDVTATKTGFQTVTSRNVVLTLNAVYSLSMTLQVGGMNETVEVQANPAQVETTNTQVNTVVQGQQIVNLPLIGRNWTQLQQLAPGVVATSDRFGTYATNGSQSQQNSFLINGMDAVDLPLNTPLVIPSPDAIAEFNLVTSTINPEFGRNSGGIMNAIIKSGTNKFHGSAFEFYRDTFLNNRNIFQLTKPIFHQNQFGGTIGGPIIKNHTFFLFSYQGTRFAQPQTSGANGGQTTVFSQAQRNGLFPDIASSTATSPFPLVGSSGATFAAGTPYSVIFPTGQIPAADFNPVAVNLMTKYVPLPNAAGNLYSFNPVTTGLTDQPILRIDHTMQNDSLWWTSIFQRNPTIDTEPFTGATLPGFGDINQRHTYANSAAWTHTFNPSTINEFRVSWLRFNYQAVEPQTPMLPSSVGFNINPQNTASAGLPLVSLTGYFTLGFSNNGPQPRVDSTYQLADSFTKVKGTHTIKAGYDGKRYQVNNPFFGNNNGNFSFGGSGLYSTGDPGADFLLGIPDTYTQGSGGWIDARTYEHYFYIQDSWRIKKKLTINYGAGYQIDTPVVNHHFNGEALNCFRPGEQSAVFPTAPQGLTFPGDPGCTSSGYFTHYGDIGPRFGFAYALNPKTSIRGGFGVYFNRVEEELTLQNLTAPPFSLTSGGIGDVGGNPSFANPWVDIASGQAIGNKFPFTPPAPGNRTVDFSFYEPMSLNVLNPNFTTPYAMNYNLNVERELPGAMVLTVAYVGAQGRHLEIAYEGNPITFAGQAACLATPSCISNRVLQQVLYPTHTEYEPGDIIASAGTQSTVGVSHYSALQINLNKRFSHGLAFQASYTWSRSLDDTSGFEQSSFGTRGANPYNFNLNYGDSDFDARQRFVTYYDYELPHLKREHNRTIRYLTDGWHLAGITTFQTGFPITLANSFFPSLTCGAAFSFYGCPDSVNTVASTQFFNPRNSAVVNNVRNPANTNALPYYYFNPNSFAMPAFGQFGTAGRNFFHGPGINNTDLVLSKRIWFTEFKFLELRLEGYNVFNHTQFSTSASEGGSAVTGDGNSSNFGRILSAASGRTVQIAGKFYF